MFAFKSVDNEAFLKGFASIRDDIMKNNFRLDPHANERIVDRGFGIADIKDVVTNGQFSLVPRRFTRDGWFYAAYYHRSIFLVACREWGQWHAAPTIVTMFRDAMNYEPALDEMIATPRVVEVEKIVTKEIVKEVPVDAMSDEEFEAYARRRIEQRRAHLQAQIEGLDREIDALRARRGELEQRLG